MNATTRHELNWTIGIAAATLAIAAAVIVPQHLRKRQLTESLKSETRLVAEGRNDLKEMPRLQVEVDRLQHQLRNFDQQIPRQDELGPYLERLARVAQEHELRPGSIEPAAPLRSRDLFAVPIVVKVHGPFRNVYGMLKDVLALPRLTQVQRFETKVVADRPGEVEAEMQLRVFYRAS